VPSFPFRHAKLRYATLYYTRDSALKQTEPPPDDVSVFDVLRKGLQDLADMCDVIEEKFVAARDDFKVTNPDGGPGRKDELRERSN
jgi:hypothetical protein